tara:strand:- start:389 stop:736 length:348 start_codon:yes stop_codon:yes gene_type:complete
MTISNTAVVDTTLKYIVKSTGIKDEDNQIMVDAEKLKDGTNKSKVNLIECFYLIEGTGTITISASSEDDDLELTGKGKYGLRPDQLKFGNDKKILLSTNGTVDSYLIVTEFRRND